MLTPRTRYDVAAYCAPHVRSTAGRQTMKKLISIAAVLYVFVVLSVIR